MLAVLRCGTTELRSRVVYNNSNLELEAERDRNEVRVAVLGEHGVESRFDERLEATQVERESTADVDAELGLCIADIQTIEIARKLQAIQTKSTDRVRARRGGRVSKRNHDVSEEREDAGVSVDV